MKAYSHCKLPECKGFLLFLGLYVGSAKGGIRPLAPESPWRPLKRQLPGNVGWKGGPCHRLFFSVWTGFQHELPWQSGEARESVLWRQFWL